MDSNIDISNLDKSKLLYCLWKGQVTAGYFTATGTTPPDYNEAGASKVVANGYIDYYQGRAIKTDLSKDIVDPWLYDRDAGKGKFAKIVSDLRAGTVKV